MPSILEPAYGIPVSVVTDPGEDRETSQPFILSVGYRGTAWLRRKEGCRPVSEPCSQTLGSHRGEQQWGYLGNRFSQQVLPVTV